MKNTDRASEEQYLQETMEVIETNLENYGSEVARMQQDIDEMLEHYHDNDVEVWTILQQHHHSERAHEARAGAK